MRIGLVGVDSSHAEHFLRLFNAEERHGGLRVTTMWPAGASSSRIAAVLALAPEVEVAPSLDVLIAAVDAVIVGDRHADLHAPHAVPCLAAGKPVFIDKPLARTLADATAIVDAAHRTGTPVLSASALRWQDDTIRLKARLAYLDRPAAASAYGTWYPQSEYGGAVFYAIHTIELVQELFGTDWIDLRREPGRPAAVRCRIGQDSVGLEFEPLGTSGSSEFGVSVRSPSLAFRQPISLPDDYMRPVVDRIAGMLRTGRSPLSGDALLAPIRMMTEIEALLAAIG